MQLMRPTGCPFRLAIILVTNLAISLGCTKHPGTDLGAGSRLKLEARERSTTKDGVVVIKERQLNWEKSKTAIIVCDMWDDHWCKGAARRVVELAGPMNVVLEKARSQGIFIIHAPSTTVDFYKDSPARKRAIDAPLSKASVPLSTKERWGTAWCWPQKDREPDMPIDDSDMGCDCEETCKIRDAWSRQIATIVIDESKDAISDNGQEVYNLLAARGIDNVVLLGVHLNMCVLGRPFGIRQMVSVGKNVVLMRDMTDTMYNSRMRPGVYHHTGTDLVVAHVERHWCPSIQSTDIVGGQPFRFSDDPRLTNQKSP